MGLSSSAACQAELDFDFHGLAVQLAYPTFAGDPLRQLLAPFGQARVEMPRLRVELSTTARPVPARLGVEWVPTFCHGLAQGYSNGGEHVLSDGASLLEISPARGLLLGTLHGPPVSAVTSGMIHVALCLLLREHGIFDAHAAVACVRDQALLVVGDAGSGKTTTLLSLLRAGARYLGDDRVLLRSGASGVELLGYPRDFHLTSTTLDAHPTLPVDLAGTAVDGKLRLDPNQAFPGAFLAQFRGPITLLAPSVQAQSTTTLARLSSADALGRLLSASATVALEVLPRRDEQLALLALLASSVKAFEVKLGRDLLTEPERASAKLLALIEGS